MKTVREISSKSNSNIKFARSVRDGHEQKLIFLEGLRLCEELLKSNVKPTLVFFSERFQRSDRERELLLQLQSLECDVFQTNETILASLADTKTPQGIIAICEKPENGQEIFEDSLPANALLLLLHQINNPANLGAILRTAEAAGIHGVITTKGSSDAFSPKSLRSGLGANLRLPIWCNADFQEVLTWAAKNGIGSVCADISGKLNYTEINWMLPKILVLGSEGHGLTDLEIAATDETMLIPMENNVESLNVAVASGIVMFEAKRQRSLK